MSDLQIVTALERGFEFEIPIVNGTVQLEPGLAGAVVLSLFGGNIEDDGSDALLSEQYWGNLLETEEAFMYRSRTQYLLKRLPPIPSSVSRIDAAVLEDLKWMLDASVANEITSQTSIPALNRVQIDVVIEAKGIETHFLFARNWKASV